MGTHEIFFLLGALFAVVLGSLINAIWDAQLKKERERNAKIQAAFCKRMDEARKSK